MKAFDKLTTNTKAIQPKAAKQAPVDAILNDYKTNVQLKTVEEDELLQGKFETTQLEKVEEDELLQGKFNTAQLKAEEDVPLQKKANNTGLPESLKLGVENLSGYAMDDVKVHYNSGKPSDIQAHAYAQGTDIHVAPGQEKHLPHEAWHVVQQKQGRVKPTMQMKGKVNVNDDIGLETEADVMGAKALQLHEIVAQKKATSFSSNNEVLQAVFSQVTAGRQTSVHGGVTAGYDITTNLVDLHIGAGANANGNMMKDFLTALWEARDTIVAGQARNGLVAGGVEMHPGGSQVLKMTMEMLGEAAGQAPHLAHARAAKDIRQQNNIPLGYGILPNQINDVLDGTIVPEHIAYRNSLVGVAGVTMSPVGGGTNGGTVDMLNGGGAAAERILYDTALATLQPFMSIAVTITLPILRQVITMIEGKLTFFQKLALKASYAING